MKGEGLMQAFFFQPISGMPLVDWLVVAVYLLVAVSVGLAFAKRASSGVEDFFLAGRNLPWWLAGASMVASMFASDTPLFHSGNVRDMGLSASWLFFFPMFGAMLAAAYFARLVRRTRVVTDAEFVELRYSGQAPTPFRAFLAVYNGIFVAALTMGWVTLGMTETVAQILHLDKLPVIVVLMGIVLVYAMVSGMWGVVMADLFQYAVATIGSLYLAAVSVQACGGLAGLRQKLAAMAGWAGRDLHFLPKFTEGVGSATMVAMTVPMVLAWILVNSAAQASSSAHQGQRVLACRDERDAGLSYVMFAFCYYVINGMSWVIVGLASVVVLGATNEAAGLANSQRTFPAMIVKLMPHGMLGLMVASIFAAFMSCASVVLNWGSSYMINDIYRRFLVRAASPKHYVRASRVASLLLGIGAGYFAMIFDTLSDFFSMVPALLTGSVLVMLARYLWWRANIWSEVAAMVASPIVGCYVEFVLGARGHKSALAWLPGYAIWDADQAHGNNWAFLGHRLFAAVGLTTLSWIIVTLLTKPTEMEKLKKFYLLVRPSGPGWRHVRKQFAAPPPVEKGRTIVWIWLAGVTFILGSIFAVAQWLRGHYGTMALSIVAAIVGALLMNMGLNSVNKTALAYEASLKTEPTPTGEPKVEANA